MMVQYFTFGPFGTNCYVVSDNAGHVLLVDPACANAYEQQQLLGYIQSLSATSVRILATHGHLDHLWGAKWASEQWNTPIFMHEADMPLVQAMQQQYDLFGIRAVVQTFPIESLPEASTLMPAMQYIHTPGHTPGSICLYWEQDQVLLSGDTLFCMGYGRTDLPGGNTAQLIRSLEHLMTLPAEVKVYPGHGDFTSIGAERR